MNNSGSKTVPCGTPLITFLLADIQPLIETQNFLPIKKSAIQEDNFSDAQLINWDFIESLLKVDIDNINLTTIV